MLRRWGTLVLILFAAPALALAQNTGKLSGQVIDASSGEPLPGAAVVVEDTQLGAATDIDGNYFIIGVPVGTYSVRASFVGFSPQTIEGVEISSGYTSELNFEVSPGVELEGVVVEYERPLIQKDAIGDPKIATGEEITNLPVRGVAQVASIQAGVVSQEGSDELNIRGGRDAEITYYVDGVKVIGDVGVPQQAIQEQEMLIGNISARYGDAMSGVINITTKTGGQNFFGSLEAISSEVLDPYGYNLLSGTLGGPVVGERVNFFLAAEYNTVQDNDPRAVGVLSLQDGLLDDLRTAPLGFLGTGTNGENVVLPIPAGLSSGATLPVDSSGQVIVQNGTITASDGTVIQVPGGVDPTSIDLDPVERAAYLGDSDFTTNSARPSQGTDNLTLTGNLTWSVFDNGRLRVGGRYGNREFQSLGGNTDTQRRTVLAPDMHRVLAREEYQIYGTWTQYLSNSTFYQLHVDFTDYRRENYDPRIGTGFSDLLRYGDIDDPTFAPLRGYKQFSTVDEERVVGEDTFTVAVPTYENVYEDGQDPTSEATTSLLTPVGGQFNTYSKAHDRQFRLTASATTQLGINQIEFGGEYEQRTERFWDIDAFELARYVNDGNPEGIDPNDPDQNPEGYSDYEDIPPFLIDNFIANYYGYSVNGTEEVDGEDLTQLINTDKSKPLADYNVAPYKPIYYGAYVQDKIEFRDIVLNLGLRVDVFDNNTRTLKDPFARRPIFRAGALDQDVPGSIGDDYAVYFSGDNVVGYRDLDGRFYDTNGQQTGSGDVLLAGKPRQTSDQITADMFEDYEPQVTVMPRIGVSFPVTDQALFFARYGIIAQRPSERLYATLNQFTGTGGINNNNLKPERTTEYELGFRQRLGARSALTISGFFRQIDNLIQLRDIPTAFPNAYSTWENVDFGTVKGFEFGYDLRRTGNVSANANYTLSFADGTGSDATTTSTIVWIDETPPNFISALSFDQRHSINVSVDYRLGEGEGPTVFGAKPLQDFGFNVLLKAGSGFPYTSVTEPAAINASRAPLPSGGINEDRVPWTSRVDLKVDRRFRFGGADFTAFLWVQNLLNSDNIFNVWRATGLASDDGFLATRQGQQFLDGRPPATTTYYRHRETLVNDNGLISYGIPRLTRLGVRFNF